MTDLAREVAAAVRPPDFDTLVRRAERRRVRRRVGATVAVASAVVVGAVGVAALGPSGAKREPVAPSPPSADSSSPSPTRSRVTGPASVIASGTFTDYAVDGHGDLLTKWQSCQPAPNDGRCAYALKFSSPDGTAALLSDRFQDSIVGGSDGFVRTSWAGESTLLTGNDPSSFISVLKTASGHIGAGTVLVPGSAKFSLRAVDPATETSWPLTSDCVPHQAGWGASAVSRTGTAWAIPLLQNPQETAGIPTTGPTTMCESTDGSAWHAAFTIPAEAHTTPATITASGRHVAVIMTGDGSATITPVVAMWATSDGTHWAKLSRPPFDTMDSMAATSDGVLFLAAGDGTLYRSADWSTFTKVDAPKVWNLQANGDTVAAQVAGPEPRLVTVTDDGTVNPWPVPLR